MSKISLDAKCPQIDGETRIAIEKAKKQAARLTAVCFPGKHPRRGFTKADLAQLMQVGKEIKDDPYI